MLDLKIQTLHDRNILIYLVQYRNLYENDPTHEEEWKLLIFDPKVGFNEGDIVLVAQILYLADDNTLIHICEVSDQKTTDERIIPYLQRKINRESLLK